MRRSCSIVSRSSSGRRPRNSSELEALLAEQRDPGSPSFRRWLSPEEYAERFGMSEADLEQVRAWLVSQGLVVQATARSRNELFFRGTAAQIERAFRTELHRYRVGHEVHFANSTEPSVPAAFADVVLAIRKLSDFRPQPRLRRPFAAPRFTSAISGNHFLAPDDFATIYDVHPLWAAGWDGTGQRIAVIGQTALGPGSSAADVDAFRAASGLPPTLLQQVLVPGSGSSTVCSGDILEAHLDVQWAGAVARNATVVYVYTGVRAGRNCQTTDFNVWDALQHAVANNLAPVISMSYGACEAANGLGFAQTVRSWAQQANAQGQTDHHGVGGSGRRRLRAAGLPVRDDGPRGRRPVRHSRSDERRRHALRRRRRQRGHVLERDEQREQRVGAAVHRRVGLGRFGRSTSSSAAGSPRAAAARAASSRSRSGRAASACRRTDGATCRTSPWQRPRCTTRT